MFTLLNDIKNYHDQSGNTTGHHYAILFNASELEWCKKECHCCKL